jgi:HAD superfamily hydrolase (TIGR01549 family)
MKKPGRTKLKLAVFDLDGTLVKSDDTIYKSMCYALRAVGVTANPDKNKFDGVIGHHFREIFTALELEVKDLEEFMTHYKSSYFNFIEYSALYPGVKSTMDWLKANNIKVALLTTKLQDQAELIIDHFNLSNYFDEIVGRRQGMPYKPAPEPLLEICINLAVAPGRTLMIGDSELDIKCGKKAGSKTCAATYGYRNREILESERPDFIIDSIDKLIEIFNHSS